MAGLLRDSLYEEEATRDLTKAAAGYEALLAAWNEVRPTAAAALFRLAEVRRKQDRKEEAVGLYERLLREFPEMEVQGRMARENLAALGVRLGEREGWNICPTSTLSRLALLSPHTMTWGDSGLPT